MAVSGLRAKECGPSSNSPRLGFFCELEGDALKGTGEKLRIQLYSLPNEEIINLWQSFSEKSFLLSTCYQVTPVSIDAAPREETQRVVEKKDDYHDAAAERREHNA